MGRKAMKIMAVLYLHIGMPKTGTSSIQNFLMQNNNVLNEKGYVYPDFKVYFKNIGKNRNGQFLVGHLHDESGMRDYNAEKALFDKNFDIISQLSQKYPNIILSEESLWNSAERHSGKDFWRKIKSETDKRNLELKIIVYLRRQDLFLQSFWAQHVKVNSTLSLKEYINSRKSKIKLDYYSRLNEIAEYVGKENILVRVFEKQQYLGTDNTLISDFLETIGLSLTDEYKALDKPANLSLSGVYLEIKRHMNKYPEFKNHRNYFSKLLKEVQENNSGIVGYESAKLFKYDELIELLSKYSESNKNVAKMYLNRSDGVLFRDEIKKYDDSKVNGYSSEEIVDVMKQIIELQHSHNQEKIKELNSIIKKQKSTIDWMSVSFPKKVTRKLKNMF